jgi:hypothetical protein
VRFNARAAFLLCGAADEVRFVAFDGTKMTELYPFQLTRPARLAGLARHGDSSAGRQGKVAVKYFNSKYVWLPAMLVAGVGTWMLLAGYASNTAESEPMRLATAAVTEPTPSPTAPASDAAQDRPQDGSPVNFATAPTEAITEAITPVETAPVDGVKISSQSWRRGGLGSNALVTFTLRNGNDYAVKDIEIFCSFARRDGSHLTDRKRTIHDTVSMKSRRTFARLHIGFVNINAEQAKCSLVAASHI